MPRRGALVLALLLAGRFTASAQGATKTVFAGAPVSKPPKGVPKDADTDAYYRDRVTIHVGDRVRFRINGFHTVTFPARGTKPPGFIAPDAGTAVAGSLDAAGAPFWFNGRPRLILDSEGAFPAGGKTFTGSKLTGSGAPLEDGPPKPYTLRFTRRGTFNFYCVVHPGMRGKVVVRSRSSRVPSAAADRRAVRRQFARAVRRVKALDAFDGPSGNRIDAGHDRGDATLLRFFPTSKQVRVGESVTLAMSSGTREIHTFSFGPPAYLQAQGEAFVTADPASPPGGPPTLVFNPILGYPSDAPPAFAPIQPALHGNGFFNTGVLDRGSGTPAPASVRVAFSQPGTYRYICLIHPDMRGRIVVTS